MSARRVGGALLFDLDGTLTDSAPGIVRCIAYALETHDLPPVPVDRLRACVGPPLHDSFLELSRDPRLVDALVATYRERYVDVGMFENTIYEGIVEGLDALLAAGATLHVVTSKPAVYAEQILEHFDLRRRFGAVYGARLDGQGSNKAELIDLACRGEALDPATSAMIGDRGVDMAGARAHGVRAWGVRWGYGSDEELDAAGAHALLDAPAQLVARWRSTGSGGASPGR